jgi:hypothetical protein
VIRMDAIHAPAFGVPEVIINQVDGHEPVSRTLALSRAGVSSMPERILSLWLGRYRYNRCPDADEPKPRLARRRHWQPMRSTAA